MRNAAGCIGGAGREMTWATSPVTTKDLNLFAGLNEAASETTYTPGQPIQISLRAKTLDKLYRGLLLYAVDTNGNHVGGWRLIDRDIKFQVSATCPNRSVIHSNADVKPSLVTFIYTPPAAGTGPITFESLVKSVRRRALRLFVCLFV